MKWWRVFFKGGEEDRPHEEVFGVQAENIDGARAQALKEMREEFMIRYPEIYRIEENGDVRHRHEIIADLVAARKRIYDMEKVIEAARCIRHWHDSGAEGMVVSASHVFALWTALDKLDESPNGSNNAAMSAVRC